MLQRLVRALRQKPKAVRDQYAFGAAATFTGVVALGWLLSFSLSPLQLAPQTAAVADAPQPSAISDMMNTIQAELGNVDDTQPSSAPAVAPTTPVTPAATPTTVPSVPVRIATFTASTTN